MSAENQQPVPGIKVWVLASRPKTLPAAAAPVLVGAAIAYHDEVFALLPVLAAFLCALLLQIGANLANDLYDYLKGADTHQRVGPTRVTQSGLATPRQVKTAMLLTFGLAMLVGMYLIFLGGIPILVIGILAIISAIAYTGGPFPLGYNGLGDVFVFIFFGLAAVCGTYYIQAGTLNLSAWLSAIPMGLLATAILVVNNLRDIQTDRLAGKKTLAVRLGRRGAQLQYTLLLLLAPLFPMIMIFVNLASPWVLAIFLATPLALRLLKSVWNEEGAVLNKTLAGTGQLELLFATLFSLGLLIQ